MGVREWVDREKEIEFVDVKMIGGLDGFDVIGWFVWRCSYR